MTQSLVVNTQDFSISEGNVYNNAQGFIFVLTHKDNYKLSLLKTACLSTKASCIKYDPLATTIFIDNKNQPINLGRPDSIPSGWTAEEIILIILQAEEKLDRNFFKNKLMGLGQDYKAVKRTFSPPFTPLINEN